MNPERIPGQYLDVPYSGDDGIVLPPDKHGFADDPQLDEAICCDSCLESDDTCLSRCEDCLSGEGYRRNQRVNVKKDSLSCPTCHSGRHSHSGRYSHSDRTHHHSHQEHGPSQSPYYDFSDVPSRYNEPSLYETLAYGTPFIDRHDAVPQLASEYYGQRDNWSQKTEPSSFGHPSGRPQDNWSHGVTPSSFDRPTGRPQNNWSQEVTSSAYGPSRGRPSRIGNAVSLTSRVLAPVKFFHKDHARGSSNVCCADCQASDMSCLAYCQRNWLQALPQCKDGVPMSRTHKSISAIFNLQQSHVPLLAIVLSTPGLGGNGYPEVISAFSLIVTGAQRRAKGHILHFASRLAPQRYMQYAIDPSVPSHMPDASCRGFCASEVQRMCKRQEFVVDFGCHEPGCSASAPSYCG